MSSFMATVSAVLCIAVLHVLKYSNRPRIYKYTPEQKFEQPFPHPKNFGDPKTSKLRRDFGQLCYLIANISGTQQDIVNRKTALQTMITPARAFNLLNVSPQTARIGPKGTSTNQKSTFSLFRKFNNWYREWPRLAMHQQFFNRLKFEIYDGHKCCVFWLLSSEFVWNRTKIFHVMCPDKSMKILS